VTIPNQFPKLRTDGQPQQSRVQDNVSTLLAPIAAALGRTPLLGGLPAWTNLDVLNGLSSGYVANAFVGPQFHIDGFRYCHVRGKVTNATAGAIALSIARLPSGARPIAYTYFRTIYSLAGATVNLIVQPDGFILPDSIAAGENINFSFEFLAEQ
jgi:hypothetical protein